MKRFLIFVCISILSFPLLSQSSSEDSMAVFPTFSLQNGQKRIQIENEAMEIWEDANGQRSIESVSRVSFRKFFHPIAPSQKLKPFHVYWLAFKIESTLDIDSEWILSLGKLTNADVYFPNSEGAFALKQTGQFVSTTKKDVKTGRFNSVNLFLPAKSVRTVFIRIQNQVNFTPDPNALLINKNTWQDLIIKENLIQGFFHGLLGMMFFYNFLLFIRVGDRAYFFYLAYILSTSIYLLNYHGYWGEFIVKDFPVFNYLYMPFTGYLAFIFYLQFMRDYLRSKTQMPYWDIWIRFLMGFFIIIMGLMLVIATFDYQFYMKGEKYINAGIMGVLLMVILFILFQNNALSRYFVLGTICMLLGTMVLLLGSSSVYKITNNVWWYQLGIVLELGLFSLGLSERYKLSEKEVQKARKDLIDQLQENQRIQDEANQELEGKVKHRTSEIEKQNEEILMQSEEISAQRDLLELQKVDLEDKNKHITDSIVYASRIQTAIMDDYKEIEDKFEEAFIFYRPKDIVSGDFYWFAEVNAPPSTIARQNLVGAASQRGDYEESTIKHHSEVAEIPMIGSKKQNNKIKIVIVADCTGHGVPGAFMTVMGNSLLNEIIHEKKITEPAIILSELDKKVMSTLRKQGAKRQLYDGMDMSILTYDEESKTLHFAGATNPLYMVRNDEIRVINASKYSIGYSSYYKDKNFTQESIFVQEGDAFYMTSDGFQDQFGGMQSRKFMKKQFREMLLQISHLPMQTQKLKLGNILDDWRKSNPQTDDILVVGIRF
jgi:serine phosphatase RsbU (regulator of sigma subunit)